MFFLFCFFCVICKKLNGNFCIYKIVDCLQEVLLTMDATFSVLVLTFFRALYTIHTQMKWLTVNIEHSVVNKDLLSLLSLLYFFYIF